MLLPAQKRFKLITPFLAWGEPPNKTLQNADFAPCDSQIARVHPRIVQAIGEDSVTDGHKVRWGLTNCYGGFDVAIVINQISGPLAGFQVLHYKHKPMRSTRLRMILPAIFAVFLALVAFRSPVMGQGTTTSSLTGFVSDNMGKPLAGATVVAVDTTSGSRYVATTRVNGQYNLTGMRAGGPYSVTVTAGSFPPATKENIMLDISETAKADFSVSSDVVKLEAVSVVGSQDPTFAGSAMSSALALNSSEVMQVASVRRDIQDIQNLDPRANVMQVGVSDSQYTVSFDGQNPRENLLLIDGVSGNDNFGLNSNGVAGFRNPVPPEWIQSFNLDLNPYDLIYSGFTGGVTNIEIKSGTNEFHGDIYAIYTGANFRGPDPVVGPLGAHEPENEHTYGVTLGGPIIKNKLFFFLGYDSFRELAAPPVQEFLPDDSGGVISQIIAHTQSAYGFNPGTLTAINHAAQQNFVGKIDWNINDAQKFEFTFRHTDGQAPNFYNYTGSFETSLSSSWYDTHRTDQSYTAKLESDWSQIIPNFHTEIEATYKRYNGTAILNGADFPAVQINGVPGVSVGGGSPPYELFLGQYWAYQDNNIYTWEQEEHIYGEYSLGNHTLKFGVQFDRTGYTDTFIPNVLGSYSFDSPAEYLAGTPTYVQQESPYPGYSLGSDVSHYYSMYISPLIEDTWRPTDALTVLAGVRFDYFDEPQRPPFSPAFYNAYGYRNNSYADGAAVTSPRVGFNYNLPTERKTQIRGGAGLIMGSFPTVWYENSFNNAGQLNTISTGSTSSSATTAVVPGYTFGGVNSPSLIGKVPPSSAVPSFDVIDPNFKLPSNWKENIAIDHELPFWHMILTLDADFTQVNKDVKILQLNYAQAATGPAFLPDGAIRYAGNITPALATSTAKDINGVPYPAQYLSGTMSVINGVTSTSSSTMNANKATGPVYFLTNTDKGGSQTFAVSLHTPFVDGWQWSLGYAHVHATEVDPSPSSTASGGYSDILGVNPNDNVAYRSEYAIPDKIVATLTKRFNFFTAHNAATEISAQFLAQTGQSYSYVFKGDADGDALTSTSLMYVPTGPNDPKVAWASAADEAAFFGTYLPQHPELEKYEGKIAPRNAFYAPWQRTINLHVEQQIPIYGPGKLIVFADCYNFANLLNRSWGIVTNYDGSFNSRTAVGTVFNATTNQYVYLFNAATQNSSTIYPDMSRYNIQIGARLEF
jgi:outer membrane receptor for ferrienterochelin and colicin